MHEVGIAQRIVDVIRQTADANLEAARKEGVDLLSLVPFKTLGLPLLRGVMNRDEWNVLSRYLENPDHFQDADVQREIRSLAEAQ